MQSRCRISGRSNALPTLLVWPLALSPFLSLVRSAAAQTLTELYPFNSSDDLSDGAWPEAGVTRDAAGNLYGTTFFGGTGAGCDIYFGGCGTVFKVDTRSPIAWLAGRRVTWQLVSSPYFFFRVSNT